MINFKNIKQKTSKTSTKLIKSICRAVFMFILCCFLLSPIFALSSCKKNDNNKASENSAGGADSQTVKAEYTSKEIVDAIIAAYPKSDIPEMRYYFSGADEESENYLNDGMAGMMMTGIYSPLEEFDYLLDYAFDTPASNNVFEIDIARVKSGSQQEIDAVVKIFENRLKRKSSGDIIAYNQEETPMLESAKIFTAGNYVIFLATTDNSTAEKIINDMLGENDVSLLNITAEPSETITEQTTTAALNADGANQIVNIEPETIVDFNLLSLESLESPASAAVENTSGQAVTYSPTVKVHMYSQNTMCFIGGTCELGAKVKVTGGTEEIITNSDYGNFFVEVPFAETGITVLKLTAIADGKLPSAEITFIVKPRKDVTLFEDGGLYGNVVGYNYQYFCADSLASFEGDDLIKENEIKALQTRTEKKIQNLRDKGCEAEIIYLLIPNPMRIYAEDAPARYKQNTGETLRTQWKGAVTAGGATVIDLTDLFMEHKNDEFKIFQKTDTHWSEYGALLGYKALMSYIGQKFPDALPRPDSDFEITNREFNWGDMYSRFYLSPSDIKETTATVKFNFEPPGKRMDLYENGNSLNLVHAKVSDAQTTHTNLTGNFPSVYIYRDSFAGPLHDFLTDRFSTANFVSMWNYGWKLNDIVSENPDYVLYIINERNIVNIMYD